MVTYKAYNAYVGHCVFLLTTCNTFKAYKLKADKLVLLLLELPGHPILNEIILITNQPVNLKLNPHETYL